MKGWKTMYRKSGVVLFATAFFIFALVFSSCAASNGVDPVLTRARREHKLVMLELGSVGCIPCEEMRPVMDKLRADYKSKLEVLFIDVRKDHESARRFRVYMIPTQVFLDENGKEFHRHLGYYSFGEIQAVLKKKGL